MSLICGVFLWSRNGFVIGDVQNHKVHLTPYFVGRQEYLQKLEKILLASGEESVPVAVLYGIAGIGKTAIASAFAKNHARDFSAIYEITCDSKEAYHDAYINLANQLGILYSTREKISLEEIRAKVHSFLEQKSDKLPWLLILDNANIPLELPKQGNGRVLILSRTRDFFWTQFPCLSVGHFTEEEAVELLEKVKKGGTRANHILIAKELDYFPSAVEQAAHYLANSSTMTEERFLELLREDGVSFLEHIPQQMGYLTSFEKSWQLTADDLHREHPEALQWLYFSSYLYPETIPYSWVGHWLALFHPELGHGDLSREIQVDKILTVLSDYSLLRFDKNSGFLSIHRLKQEIVQRDKYFDPATQEKVFTFLMEQARGLERFEEYMYRGYEWEEGKTWKLSTSWFLEHYAREVSSEPVSIFLSILGNERLMEGDLKNANTYHERALNMRKTLFQEEHASIADSIYNLSGVLWFQGDYLGASNLAKQALEIREKIGSDSLPVAASMYALAWTLGYQGKYEEAKAYAEQGLKIRQRLLPSGDAWIAESMHALAVNLECLGQYGEAEQLFKEALFIRQKCLPKNHWLIGLSFSYLGLALEKQGRYREAMECQNKALSITSSHDFLKLIR